jgi:hypothetical protein
VARCAANIMKVYFKNEKKPICIEIFIQSLKYINIFLILYMKCARKIVYVLQCATNQKRSITSDPDNTSLSIGQGEIMPVNEVRKLSYRLESECEL